MTMVQRCVVECEVTTCQRYGVSEEFDIYFYEGMEKDVVCGACSGKITKIEPVADEREA